MTVGCSCGLQPDSHLRMATYMASFDGGTVLGRLKAALGSLVGARQTHVASSEPNLLGRLPAGVLELVASFTVVDPRRGMRGSWDETAVDAHGDAIPPDDGGVRTLCRFASASKRLRDVVTDPARLDRLLGGLDGFEQAALSRQLEALADADGVVQVKFRGASAALREECVPRLRAFGRVVRRHSASIRVDAHTGRHAPAGYARMFTGERAAEVLSALCADDGGVQPAALLSWGNSVAVAHDWPPGIFSARAELYATMDGGRWFPPLAAHYGPQPLPRTRTSFNGLETVTEQIPAGLRPADPGKTFLMPEVGPDVELDDAFVGWLAERRAHAGQFVALARCPDAPARAELDAAAAAWDTLFDREKRRLPWAQRVDKKMAAVEWARSLWPRRFHGRPDDHNLMYLEGASLRQYTRFG